MKYFVSYGGGVTSATALERCILRHGRENTVAIFAEVGQVLDDLGRVIDGECHDLYRFMGEVEEELRFNITRIKSDKYGPGIWSTFFGERMMGSTRMDPCSKHLKRKVLDSYHREHCGPEDVVVAGLDWQEPSRLERFRDALSPRQVWFPLCDHPRLTKSRLILDWIGRGIEPPLLYEEGFAHNNCSGFCVKGGLHHFYTLWVNRPWVYAHHEAQEAKFRREIAPNTPNATILRSQTMAELRAKFESGYVPVKRGGGCRGTCVIPVKDEFPVTV